MRKNVILKKSTYNGKASRKLFDLTGQEFTAFGRYMDRISDLPWNTRARYAIVLSIFLDFLYEAGAFTAELTQAKIHRIIDGFFTFLEYGSCHIISPESPFRQSNQDEWLVTLATRIYQKPYAAKSFSNTFAPIRSFLETARDTANEARERATLMNSSEPVETFSQMIRLSLNGLRTQAEAWNLRQNGVLGEIIRVTGTEIERKRGLGRFAKATKVCAPFPVEYFSKLIDCATSWRDAAMWSMEGVLGLRPSEVLNMYRTDIVNSEIYVIDPKERRFGKDVTRLDSVRFKGRIMSTTFAIPELSHLMWSCLENYLDQEFVPYASVNVPDYLFQYIEPGRRGMPLIDSHMSTLDEAFKKACARCGVPAPRLPDSPAEKEWSRYSLRHMYGNYLLNNLQMPLEEVSVCMGHASVEHTHAYAKLNRDEINRRLESRRFPSSAEVND